MDTHTKKGMAMTDAFPVDWTEWHDEWKAWRTAHAADLRPTSWRFPGKNFLADDVLGAWSIAGRNVELSEVTMPAFGERPERRVRYVGITFGTGAGTDTPDNPLVSTFAELEHELGIDR